jgi:hypothetical protein
VGLRFRFVPSPAWEMSSSALGPGGDGLEGVAEGRLVEGRGPGVLGCARSSPLVPWRGGHSMLNNVSGGCPLVSCSTGSSGQGAEYSLKVHDF